VLKPQTKERVYQISALEHIHSCGLVHRDIKPENIIPHKIQHSEVRLIDFGLSQPCLEGTPQIREPSIENNYILGTLSYASLNSHKAIGVPFLLLPP